MTAEKAIDVLHWLMVNEGYDPDIENAKNLIDLQDKKIKALEHILKDRYKTTIEYGEIEGDKLYIELNSEGLN